MHIFKNRELFAFFSQLFFIQPFIRTCFKAVFRRKAETAQTVKA